MGQKLGVQIRSIDQWFGDAWSRVEADAYRLARRHGADWNQYKERVCRVMGETAWTHTFHHGNQPLVEAEGRDIDTSAPPDINYCPSLEDALVHLPFMDALELFESTDRPDLMHRYFDTEDLVKAAYLFYTPAELLARTHEAIEYLDTHREGLIATGFGPKSDRLPLWIASIVEPLYPVRASASPDAEVIQGTEDIAARVQKLRPLALESKVKVLRLVVPPISGENIKLWVHDLVAAWTDLLQPEDIEFLLQADQRYYELGISAGGLFTQIRTFRLYVEEFTFVINARVREVLESARLIDTSNPLTPRLLVQGYFEARNPEQRQALDKAMHIFRHQHRLDDTDFHVEFQADLYRELRGIGIGPHLQQLLDPIAVVRPATFPIFGASGKAHDARKSAPQANLKLDDAASCFAHNDDYSSVSLDDKRYDLTRDEAKCIRILHEEYQRGFPCVQKKRILEQVKGSGGDTPPRWRDIWGQHPEICASLIADCREKRHRVRLKID